MEEVIDTPELRLKIINYLPIQELVKLRLMSHTLKEDADYLIHKKLNSVFIKDGYFDMDGIFCSELYKGNNLKLLNLFSYPYIQNYFSDVSITEKYALHLVKLVIRFVANAGTIDWLYSLIKKNNIIFDDIQIAVIVRNFCITVNNFLNSRFNGHKSIIISLLLILKYHIHASSHNKLYCFENIYQMYEYFYKINDLNSAKLLMDVFDICSYIFKRRKIENCSSKDIKN